MDELGFRVWMSANNVKNKVQSDCVSRLKRIEKELKIELDECYKETELKDVLDAFLKMGMNEKMDEYGNVNLPIGKYYMSTYRHSLKQYIAFRENDKKED